MSLANLALLLMAAWCIRFAVREMSVASDDETDNSRQRTMYSEGRILVSNCVVKVLGRKSRRDGGG